MTYLRTTQFIFPLCLLFFAGASVAGQRLSPTVVASAGASFDNGNLLLEWTLGEVATETFPVGNLVLTQGFHQPVPFDNTLPVSWLSFAAAAGAKQVDLQWETTEEPDNAGFHVERSADSRDWAAIGEVAARPGSNQVYDFVDDAPMDGTSYYRLRQTDFDGGVTYSPIATVEFSGEDQIRVYPNPADQLVTIGLPDGAQLLDLISVTGRVVKVSVSGFTGQVTANLSELPQGMYLVRVELASGEVQARRLIVRQPSF